MSKDTDPLKIFNKQIDYIVMLIIKIIYHLHVFQKMTYMN